MQPAVLTGSVFVPGEAQPKGSTRSFRKGAKVVTINDNPDTKPWQSQVSSFVRDETGPTIAIPTGPVLLALEFILPRRKAEPKRVTPPHTRKPDLDKLTRAVLDALTGLVYTDDNQVTAINPSTKRTADIGEQPGVFITWAVPQTELRFNAGAYDGCPQCVAIEQEGLK
jgi:crossover junction endodeoxyribonuclease RusA